MMGVLFFSTDGRTYSLEPRAQKTPERDLKNIKDLLADGW